MSISSKKPLYYQLKQTLLKWIEGGDYPPGSILPSEKQLQDSFGISRTTVRMALKELEQEGFLVRSPGKGTFVASMKIESGPRRILSFTQEMLNMGLQVSNQVVSLEKELPVIRTANKLQIPQDQPVWRLERIRMADSAPIATEVNYIPAALVPNMEAQLAQNQSFYSCLEEEYAMGYGRALMAAYACIGKECPGYVTSPSFKVTRENLLEGYRTSLGIEAPADVQAALNG